MSLLLLFEICGKRDGQLVSLMVAYTLILMLRGVTQQFICKFQVS